MRNRYLIMSIIFAGLTKWGFNNQLLDSLSLFAFGLFIGILICLGFGKQEVEK